MMKVIIAGHLGADVETRYTANGKKVSTLRVATNTRRAGKDETVWWRVSLWGDAFDTILPYLKKGSGVIVTGDFVRNEIYMDRDGKPQMSLEISGKTVEFNPFGKGERSDGDQASSGQSARAAGYTSSNASSNEEYASAPPAYTASYSIPPSPPESSKGEVPPRTENVPF